MEYQRQTREQRPPSSPTTGEALSGPVGLRGKVSQVKNANADQQAVIDLLTAISSADGGKKEVWGAPPLAGPTGQCPRFLADAIWEFQDFWRSRGVFHNIDGVVDPGGNTYKQMINLARHGGGGRVIPIDPPNKGDGLLSALIGMLSPRRSNLTIADVQIGIAHSATAGMLNFEVVAGNIGVSDATWPGPPRRVTIRGVGASWGKQISSSAIAPAVDRQIHVGPGNRQQLGVHDLAGKCLLVNAFSGKAGYSTTTIFFNIGPQLSLKNLNNDYAMESPIRVLRDATHSCSGFATVASSFTGGGGSVSLIEGLARAA